MAYLLLKARKKIYHGTAALFKRYGKSVSDHPGVYCVIGILIAALAFVGMPLIKIDDSLDTVWMEENSRFNSEHRVYEDNFGSLPRLGVSAFQMENGSSIITHQALESIRSVLGKLYAFDSPDSLRMDTMINGKMETMTPDDFCERPMLPDMFLPTDPTDPLSYVRKGAYQSYGYVELGKCVKKTFNHVKLLPDGWGIDKAPCMRISVLDCFKEGEVDYPTNLKLLQDVVAPIGMIMQFQSDSSFINECMDEYETKLKADMDILNIPDSAFKASEERYFLQTFTWMIFFSFGYHWRPSIYDFSTEEKLMEHVSLSMETPMMPDYRGIESCILNASSGITPRCCPVWAGTDIGYELFLGKKIIDKNGKWSGISSIRNPVVAQPFNNPLWVDDIKKKYGIDDPAELEKLVLGWENNTVNYLRSLHDEEPGTGYGPGEEFEGIKVNLHTDRSTGDMAAESAQPEFHLLILGAGMMMCYAVVVMGSFSNRCINSNILTMMGGFFVAGVSVVGGTGIMGLLGVKTMTLTVLVQLVGFILCLGNIYMLMFTFNSRLDTDKPVEDNMVATIEFGGHAIFVITATLFCGFLCGVYVPIPGFRSMCIQMAATCFLTFLLDMFIFIPIMVWNCKRTQDNRMDCFPIKRQSGKPPKKSFLTETKDLFKDYPTIRHSTTKQSLLNKFANSIYGPFILNKVIRIVIIVFFALYIGMSVYTTLQLTKDGLMMSDVAKPGTYQADFAALNEAEYEMFSSYVVTQSKNYPRHQQKNMEIYESLEKNEWLVRYPKPQAWDWLSSGATTLTGYTQIMQNIQNNITMASFARARNNSDETAFLEDSLFRPDNSESLEFSFLPEVNPKQPLPFKDFRPALHKWLGSLGMLSLPSLSCYSPETGLKADCRDENNVLKATRTAIYMKNLTTHDNIVNAIKSVRAAVDDVNTPSFKAYAYGFIFGFWGLYINLRQNIALLCGCILVGIVIPITLFHCSLNAAFLIALCMVAGIFEISASFWMLGVTLNGFSIVPLVMTIALVVQYSIFVIHSFIGLVNDRKKRAKKTLAETFPAIFSSVFSLFILIVPLAFTGVPFIRKYICLSFLSLAFTSFNIPLLLLPCILSLMGPRNFDSGCEDGDNSESDSAPTYHVPSLATSDFNHPNQANDYTRLTLRGDDDKAAARLYEVPGSDNNGRVTTTSPI